MMECLANGGKSSFAVVLFQVEVMGSISDAFIPVFALRKRFGLDLLNDFSISVIHDMNIWNDMCEAFIRCVWHYKDPSSHRHHIFFV